jgi:hypothetical protein
MIHPPINTFQEGDLYFQTGKLKEVMLRGSEGSLA